LDLADNDEAAHVESVDTADARTDLQTLDETELILELVKDISNDLDVRSLCHKILQVIVNILMTLKTFDDLY
jgi:hypothetical protein